MKISVIVPLYNKAQWVLRALDSIRRQSFRNFEVIIVDDGSTDGSFELVAKIGDPRLRIIRQQNAGPGAARNRGAAEAKGDYLAFLDADDAWDPRYLERSIRILDGTPSLASVTHGHRVVPGSAARELRWRRRRVHHGPYRVRGTDNAIRVMHTLSYMSPCATVVRRSAFERHGGFYARDRCLFGEDAYLFLRILLHEQVFISHEPLVTFFENASALSNNLGRARPLEPFLRFHEEFALGCPPELRPVLRRLLAVRAAKTACMLGFWGHIAQARQVLAPFHRDLPVLQHWALFARFAISSTGSKVAALLRSALAAKRLLGSGAPDAAPAPALSAASTVAEARSTPEGDAMALRAQADGSRPEPNAPTSAATSAHATLQSLPSPEPRMLPESRDW